MTFSTYQGKKATSRFGHLDKKAEEIKYGLPKQLESRGNKVWLTETAGKPKNDLPNKAVMAGEEWSDGNYKEAR